MPSEENTEPNVEGEDYFAPGESAQHPYGVLYQGEWETEHDGTSFAVRRHATALSAAGIPVVLKSFSNTVVNRGVPEPVPTVGLSEVVKRESEGLNRTSAGVMVPIIKHMVVSSGEKLTRVLMRGVIGPMDRSELLVGAQEAAYKMTIVYSVWERSHIAEPLARHLNFVAENWVPCEQNAELLKKSGVERVRVVPHPFDPSDDICKLVNRQPHSDGWRLFYSIGRWEPRKGYDALIGAFLMAFTPVDKVVLTIKYSGSGDWKDYPSPWESVQRWLKNMHVRDNGWTAEKLERRLVLVGKQLARSRIVELHYRNNIYVSSSHGEAWGLPAFEAKLAGNAMVHVPYGGTADFCGATDQEVPFILGKVHESYGWEPGAEWADYEIFDLAHALNKATVPHRFERPIGFERFSKERVGMLMRERVIEVARQIDPAAARYYQRGSP